MNKNYVQVIDGESQYSHIDLEENNIVNAIYVEQENDIDKGNHYIEALPYPREKKALLRASMNELPSYSFEKAKEKTDAQKIREISLLREVRFPMPFNDSLERYFYEALVTSYRARRQMVSSNTKINLTINNGIDETNCVLNGKACESTNAGFSLIGYSGCGKSSAISCAVKHYPQVIMHYNEDGSHFPQIVYLVVNCAPNSNFFSLYQGIGDAIDKALNNIKPVYASEIQKLTSLGKKAEKIKELIEAFGIGIIIFDEIQLIDFKKTKENTFESLLVLANRTKVAMAVVGTEDARDKMFKELRTSRRLGKMICADAYCEDINYFAYLVKRLFEYQWFDNVVTVTKEMVEALYDVTKGIVDQLISIYSCMHYEYLKKTKRPDINADFIYKVAKKYYPGIQDVLAKLESTNVTRELSDIRNSANEKIEELLDIARQKEEMEMLMSDTSLQKESILLSNVVANIKNIYDEFSDKQIEKVFNRIISKKANESKTEKEITKMAIEMLLKEPRKKTTKSKVVKPDITHMKDFLNI